LLLIKILINEKRPRMIRGLILLLTTFLWQCLLSQTIPDYRTINWKYAGNSYDFSLPAPTVNVTSFGAMGNGIDDDYTAVQNAMASFGGNRGIVFFPPGTYLIHGAIHLPDSISLVGSGAALSKLLFNAGENNDAINIKGTSSGPFVNIIGGYQKNSIQLTLADSGLFSMGDMAELIQDGNQHMTSTWAMDCLGQMLCIDSVSGYDIFLSSQLNMTYDSLLNPRIRKINPKEICSVECLEIERTDATTSQTSNIAFINARNCMVIGVESYNCNFAHVEARKSLNITVKNSYFTTGHSYGNGGKAYGICLHATSTACLAENNIFEQLRHAMLLQSGANGNVFAYNYSKDPFWTDVSLPSNSAGDMVLHGNYPYLNLFEGNIGQHIVIDDSHGKNGHHNTFFRNRAELYGIFMNNNPATDSTNFVGNEVTNTGFLLGNYILFGNNHFEYGNNHKGSIKPPGTNILSDESYYYDSKPNFWYTADHFPPIGIPSQLNANSNPAKARYLSGTDLTPCADTAVFTFLNEVSIQPLFEIISITYNKLTSCLDITAIFETTKNTEVLLFDNLGRLVIKDLFFPEKGINTFSLKLHNDMPANLLHISISQNKYRRYHKLYKP